MDELHAEAMAALRAALQPRVDAFVDSIPGAFAAVLLVDTGPALAVLLTVDVAREMTVDQAAGIGEVLHGISHRVPEMIIERVAERN